MLVSTAIAQHSPYYRAETTLFCMTFHKIGHLFIDIK